MTTIAIIVLCIAVALFALYGVFHWLAYHRTPVDREEDAIESEFDALVAIEASRPAPLEMPHVRAGTAYGQEVRQ